MKIAQLSPLWESVPPQLYGGTERIVSYLTEELVRQGHDVTLFASGDSVTTARLEPICAQAMRVNVSLFNREAPMTMLMEQALGKPGTFDIIHSHLDFLGFPVARRNPTPTVTTFHNRLDLPELTVQAQPPMWPGVWHRASVAKATRSPSPPFSGAPASERCRRRWPCAAPPSGIDQRQAYTARWATISGRAVAAAAPPDARRRTLKARGPIRPPFQRVRGSRGYVLWTGDGPGGIIRRGTPGVNGY